eukprot:g5587.t1
MSEFKGFAIGEKSDSHSTRRRQSLRKSGSKSVPGTSSESQESESIFACFIANAQERQIASVAERLKIQGNNYFRSGDYLQAEKLYSEALDLVKSDPQSSQLASVLLTNRAAIKMHQMNIPLALEDCMEAMGKSKRNIRSYTRAASCQMSLGQFGEAQNLLESASMMLSAEDGRYKEIIQQQNEIKRIKHDLDSIRQDFAIGMYDGIMTRCSNLSMSLKCCDEFWRIALLVSLELKLHQEDIWTQFHDAMRHLRFVINANSSSCWWGWMKLQISWSDPNQKLCTIIDQSKELLSLLKSHEVSELDTSPSPNGLISQELVNNVSRLDEVSREKDRGNAFMTQRRYSQAEGAYTRGICLIEEIGAPVHLWAVLYCNRGAAFHGQGLYLDAIRDVCITLSVNPFYVKSYLRLAQMYLELNIPSCTCGILNKMKDRCETLTHEESEQMERLMKQGENLMKMESSSMNGHKFMDLSNESGPTEIKKKFKKLALKVHPDKAPNAVRLKLSWMTRNGSPPEERTLEIRERLIEQMQHLFKQLNEANSLLLDTESKSIETEEAYTPRRRYYPEEGSNWSRHYWY